MMAVFLPGVYIHMAMFTLCARVCVAWWCLGRRACHHGSVFNTSRSDVEEELPWLLTSVYVAAAPHVRYRLGIADVSHAIGEFERQGQSMWYIAHVPAKTPACAPRIPYSTRCMPDFSV